MRRVCKGTRITEFAFIPRFSEISFQRFGNNRGGRIAIAHRSPRDVAGWSRVGAVGAHPCLRQIPASRMGCFPS